MRVGVDLHVVDGMFQGSRTHVIELFSRVAVLCPEIEFVGLLDNVDDFKKNYPAFDLPNFHLVRMPHTCAIKRLMWQLPKLQRQLKLDLLHTQYIIPLPSLSRTMVTIHDVLFESHPEYFTWFFRIRSRIFMRLAAHQASHVFTVSNYSKREICKRYGVPEEKVSVIYNGAELERYCPGDAGVGYLNKRGLVSGKYFLTVGRLEPRKNHVTLLKAYAKLGPNAPKLVIVGQRDFGFNAIFDQIADTDLGSRVLVIEDVGDVELPALYRHAIGFVYPSMAEGFGMPPIEAMSSGVPVIVADNTALTEVVGDSGILVGSQDVNALASAMELLMNDVAVRERFAGLGLDNARKFSWNASAKVLAAQYQKVDEQLKEQLRA